MIKIIVRYIILFIVLVLIQVLVLNNVKFSGYINPYLYVLFILLLPFEIPNWMLLVAGLLLGFVNDAFTNTPGMHTMATVFMSYMRPYILGMFSPRDGYEAGTLPRIHFYGFAWFFKYTGILILAHHFVLFFIEAFRFTDFFQTLFRIILSAVFTMIIVLLSQLFMTKK
ncbi:MAG: rod shape-determining protein MreD [Bacteroidota bacterium]